MDFRILIIKNRLKVNIDDDLIAFKEYEESHTPLTLDFNVIETDIEVTHRSFMNITGSNSEIIDAWGTANVKDAIRGLVPENIYHAVIFLYGLEETEAFKKGKYVAHWCTFNGVYKGTEFIEVATRPIWDTTNDAFRVMTHEIRHAYTNRARRLGLPVSDHMDATPVKEGNEIILKPYYKEADVFAEDGNRAYMNKQLAPYWEKIQSSPEFLEYMLGLVKTVLNLTLAVFKAKEQPPVANKKSLEEWAEAIKQHEGWYPGSRSYRQSNPGNLRWSPFEVGNVDNFSIFSSYGEGFKALVHQLRIAVNGKSNVYKPTDTLVDFYHKYAPSGDNNNPDAYADAIATKLGVSKVIPIKDLFNV